MKSQNDRVPDLPDGGFADDEAAREYGRQLAMDLVLLQLYRKPEVVGTHLQKRSGRRLIQWMKLATPIAAVLVVFCMTLAYRLLDSDQPRPKPSAQSDQWAVEPMGKAKFVVLAPFAVRLDAGQIQVPASREMVTIETGNAKVSARGSDFLIETAILSEDEPFPALEIKRVTRVRVVSGSVTLETAGGTLVGKPGDVLEFEDGTAPKNLGGSASEIRQ